MPDRNKSDNKNHNLREDLQHSSTGSSELKKSLDFSIERDVRDNTMTYERPSIPNDERFQVEDD